jgi:hypothetical protein
MASTDPCLFLNLDEPLLSWLHLEAESRCLSVEDLIAELLNQHAVRQSALEA